MVANAKCPVNSWGRATSPLPSTPPRLQPSPSCGEEWCSRDAHSRGLLAALQESDEEEDDSDEEDEDGEGAPRGLKIEELDEKGQPVQEKNDEEESDEDSDEESSDVEVGRWGLPG